MPREPVDEERNFLALWRWIAIGTDTVLIFFTALFDPIFRACCDPTFHVSEILFGALISSWLILLGFEGKSTIDKLRGNGK